MEVPGLITYSAPDVANTCYFERGLPNAESYFHEANQCSGHISYSLDIPPHRTRNSLFAFEHVTFVVGGQDRPKLGADNS